MQKCFKFKLYNSKKNIEIHKLINLSGEIYNHCIALYKKYYKLFKKHLNNFQLQKHITRLKQSSKSHWKELPSQSIQQITERIDNAYRKFFSYLKCKNSTRVSPPSFKKCRKYKSFTLKQGACRILDGKIIISKQGYSYFNSRKIEGTINTITIKRDTLDDIYICITTTIEKNRSKLSMTGKIAGFDFGLKQFLTPSDSIISTNNLAMTRPFMDNIVKLKKLQQCLSSKQKGSNQRLKAKLDLARLHKKITNQREFYHHKIANLLIKTYDVLCFETLNIKPMHKLWGQKISDYGFSDFFRILGSKAKEFGKKIIQIDRWCPSSKTCSSCGIVNSKLKLKDRTWDCLGCNTNHDRDKNAAINIYRVGSSTLSLENVRPRLEVVLV